MIKPKANFISNNNEYKWSKHSNTQAETVKFKKKGKSQILYMLYIDNQFKHKYTEKVK